MVQGCGTEVFSDTHWARCLVHVMKSRGPLSLSHCLPILGKELQALFNQSKGERGVVDRGKSGQINDDRSKFNFGW